MMSVKDLFLGNWKNKGVALFFAVTIWLAAYRSEKQEYSHDFRIDVRPAQAGTSPHVITSMKKKSPQGEGLVDFDGRVRMAFSGPRKQVGKLRDEPPAFAPLEIPFDREVHQFSQADFGFPRDGVEITQFIPESITVSQEESVTRKFDNLSESLAVTGLREGYEVASKQVLQGTVQVTGPKSVVAGIRLSLLATVEAERESFKGRIEVIPTFPDGISPELVRRTVQVTPTEVDVEVTLRAATETFAVEAMRITFRVPPAKVPFKIVVDDLLNDTIPVEFHGRKDEIARLRERLREQPGLSLGVRVPAFDREQGGQFTFTEDSLELYGFPGVQIRQHELRRREKKAGWSYSVTPVKEAEK